MEQVDDLAIRARRLAINLIVLLGGVFAFLLLQASAATAQELPPPPEGSDLSTSEATGTVTATSEDLSDQVEDAVISTTSEPAATTTDAAEPVTEASTSTGGTAKTTTKAVTEATSTASGTVKAKAETTTKTVTEATGTASGTAKASAETTTKAVTNGTASAVGAVKATADATVEALSNAAAAGASELAATTGTASDLAKAGQEALAEAGGAVLTASQQVLEASDEGEALLTTVATVQGATEPLMEPVEAVVGGTSADLTVLSDALEVVAGTAGAGDELSGITGTTVHSARPSSKPGSSTVTGETPGGLLALPPGPPTSQSILHGGSGPPAGLGGGASVARLASHPVPASATSSAVAEGIPGGGAGIPWSGATGPFGPALPHFPSPSSLVDGGKVLQLLTFAAFLTLLSLAASGMGRWLRLVPALARPQAFISLRERPG